ncbi:MAG: hypothetical protein HYY28_02825 [Betaproteobacteria bacterium]|nr:hypothetical protein [Betaproteobacteria bacterium]
MPGDAQVTLSWGLVDGATSYNIYRATEPGVSPTSTNLPGYMAHTGASSPFTHTGLVNGTQYFFVVTAVTSAGEKPISPGVASTPSANVAAAVQGAYAFFSALRSLLNSHNPPTKDPSDLSYTHLGAVFDSAFLNEGRNAVYEAKRMAEEMRDSPPIETLVIDHVNSYDETNQVISVGGIVTMGGIAEFVNGHEDGLFILKRQADNTTWLAYGDQRIVKGHFQVEMRTDRMQGFNAGPRQHVNFDIEAPIGTITSASVMGPGMASPLQLQQGQVRVETIVGDLAAGPEIFERDAFYGGFDPGTVVQAGTLYTLSVTKTGGESVSYPLVFRGIAVTDPVAGAINVTSPTGYTLADARLGSPLSVQWTLPTGYPIVEVRLDGWAGTQNFSCYIDNQGQFLAPNATSGSITLPALCNGETVTYAGLTVSTSGENGQRSAYMHGFSNPPVGGGGTTYSLNVSYAGSGTGSVTTDPVGSIFASGTTVFLNANPSAGSTFAGWTGACTGMSPTCMVTMSQNQSVTANFNVGEPAGSPGPFDGTYTGTWSITCPVCGDTASGTFSVPVSNGTLSNMTSAITSGTHGILFSSGTVSTSGIITGTGVPPEQCSGSVSSFTGQITVSATGDATMTMNYSRPADGTCGAESGSMTAIRLASGATTTTTTSPGSTTTTTTGGATTTTTTASTTTTTLGGGGQVTLDFSAGWNLVGNSADASLDVAAAFGDTTKVTTVWKWVAASAKWAFYAPSLVGQALADYAANKGYDVLTTVSGGEGFWVNARGSFTAALPAGNAIASASYQDPLSGTGRLVPGWNLIAIGDNKSASEFNKALSATPPNPGDIPLNLTTLWAWDNAQSNWYFYAPSLDKNGTLSGYIASKSYLDFGSRTLDPATGFWVNKP